MYMLFFLLIAIIIFKVATVFLIDSPDCLREAMKNVPVDVTTSLEDSFCRFHDSDTSAQNLNDACAKLTRGHCMNTKCCVLGKKDDISKCYAGDKTGPTFKSDNQGNKIDVDSYYYMNKCYGNC